MDISILNGLSNVREVNAINTHNTTRVQPVDALKRGSNYQYDAYIPSGQSEDDVLYCDTYNDILSTIRANKGQGI